MSKPSETYLEYSRASPLADQVGEVEPATDEEIRWQKGLQFKRALLHARKGEATPMELCYLFRKGGISFPTTHAALKAELYLGRT